MPSPFSATRQTGRLEASDFSTMGGSVPGWKTALFGSGQVGQRRDRGIGIGAGLKEDRMILTPGSERDSICSMPGASVKKRSCRWVMSFSTCSGGMPG